MIKVTNREMESKVNILRKLSNMKLPVKVSYAIAKNINTIDKELKVFISERDKLIKEYAIKDEHGNPKVENNQYLFPDGKEEECNSKYAELLDIEVELQLREINVDDLINSNVDLTPNDMLELEFMLKE
ncbi:MULTISPECIES: hypothetical protein [Clostridium]|uniref:hypothetical protein n=1 Tax=Clostridium TaxID=1485 RepID=UPI00071E9E1F|nr:MULTISPECIES: hypothetical protein [Clostridium]ALS17742.1 hypothetical protein ATD26_12925 [Clostridium butyricum]OFS21557.1 hypothetical protein HMPREF3070_12490 [Clostridium sp. HMSC19A10]